MPPNKNNRPNRPQQRPNEKSQHKNDNQIISNQLIRAIDRKRCHSINMAENSGKSVSEREREIRKKQQKFVSDLSSSASESGGWFFGLFSSPLFHCAVRSKRYSRFHFSRVPVQVDVWANAKCHQQIRGNQSNMCRRNNNNKNTNRILIF